MKILQKFKTFFNELNPKQIIALIAFVLIILLAFSAFRNSPKDIDLNKFDNFLQAGMIKKAQISGDNVIFEADGKTYRILKDSINLNELGQKTPIKAENKNYNLIIAWIFILVLGAVLLFIALKPKKQDNKAVATEASNEIIENEPLPVVSNVSFKDVSGMNEVKTELLEIVDFLKNPMKYKNFGIKLPKGVLMIGPPGVGKTLVAKAIAGEAGVPFFYQSGAGFSQIYVGMGAKKVRELFAKAKAYAPSIIFIDEIDAVGKARGNGRSDEREATLNQLLTEMDGFTDNSGVIVIAATNKIEMIDEALLRSGRFDRRVFLSLPDFTERKLILQNYLKDKSSSIDIDQLAKSTVGFSGAGLSTLVNEAAINALRNSKDIITDEDFLAVEQKVLYGQKKFKTLSKEEKEIQALYKAAKALVAEWFGVDFDKISLFEDRLLLQDLKFESKNSVISRIKTYLAGYVALEIFTQEIYTNCKKDIFQARELATKAIGDYAMNGNLFSTNADIKELLDEVKEQTAQFLLSAKNQLFSIRDYLIEHENIDKKTISKIIKNSYEE